MTFDFSKDYILEDDFVKLCSLKVEHYTDLELLSRDKAIWTYFLEKGHGGKQFEVYFNAALQQRKLKTTYPFVVHDKIKKQIAGMTRLYAYDPMFKNIKLGHTWYGKPFRGTGVNKHCKFLLFQFVFEQLKLERIGFGAYASNTVSLAAMKSVGCKQEGELRNLFPSLNGVGRTACALFSILKEEWFQTVKTDLGNKLNTNENSARS